MMDSTLNVNEQTQQPEYDLISLRDKASIESSCYESLKSAESINDLGDDFVGAPLAHSSKLEDVEARPLGIFSEEEETLVGAKLEVAQEVYHVSPDGREYLRTVRHLPWKFDQLMCSARLSHAGLDLRLLNEGCVLLVDGSFVAQVMLLDVNQLVKAVSFEQAKQLLFQQLRVVRIFKDDLTVRRDRCRAGLLATVNRIRNRKASDYSNTVDAIQLLAIMKKLCRFDYRKLSEALRDNPAISEGLRKQADRVVQLEDDVIHRNNFLRQLNAKFSDSPQELYNNLQQFNESVIENHVTLLLNNAPQYLQDELLNATGASTLVDQSAVPVFSDSIDLLDSINPDGPNDTLESSVVCFQAIRDVGSMVLQIQAKDIKVFQDMDHVLNPAIFGKPLQDLAKRWIKHVRSMQASNSVVTLTNPVYFSLCRSLEELILDIVSKTDHIPEELLRSDANGWRALKKIQWKHETDYTKCLEREYKFIVKLLKHFDPASGNTSPFEYQARRLVDGSAAKQSKIEVMFRRLLKRNHQANPLGIPDEFYVWYCLLDDVLAHVVPDLTCNLDVFEHILHSYVQLISNATVDQMETIRVITHNTLRFIVRTFQFLSVDKANLSEDNEILQLQLAAMNRLVTGSESTFTFRDLIDVFSCYWKNRNEIIEHIPSKHALPDMERIKTNLLAIALVSLKKNVKAEEMVELFRAFNDFLIDLDMVSFEWYIKPVSSFKMNSIIELHLVEVVANKWTDTANQTYRVVDPIKFRKIVKLLTDEDVGPKHCLIEVITKQLEFIAAQLQQFRWTNGSELADGEQVASTCALISAIRSSFLYLDEQHEYISFDLFMNERLKPFSNASSNSKSLDDFLKRIAFIKDSFWYFSKQNEMSVDKAVEMFQELNDAQYPTEPILQAYRQYTDHFEQYLTRQISSILLSIREFIEAPLVKNWTAEFKRDKLPKILAGVAAVWSTMASKDVSRSGKYLKPHCVQVLCVLRLLGADSNDKGVAKHLAQVLTGQGKSLVLGMIATVLALTGHKIQVVCYNKYLVERDAKDFSDLFCVFGVANAIHYSTYEGMANLVIAPEVEGKPVRLRSLVHNLLLAETYVERPKSPSTQALDNSVILMDEVDVFFTKDYYGNGYYPVATVMVPGVDMIQEKIWNLVHTSRMHYVQRVTDRMQTFITSPEFEYRNEFDKFYNKTETYDLLRDENNVCVRKATTNKELFAEHLELMINDAIEVATKPASHWKDYRLNRKDVITYKYNEKFVSFCKVRYYAVFNYFRLKQHDYAPKVDIEENYGYLNICCGALSYAMLPKNFPLILGVTGTLTTLNQQEKTAIERLYNIRKNSVMPTFFGCSNINFNPLEHFTNSSTEPGWMSAIFTQAHATIGSKRAVIVFFQDDSTLERFQSAYSGQFDRLNVLTENTDARKQEQLISEAGVAKTVTLATRGMGRGVDYKSSVAVEKNGGVHVIQTFFSLDSKEETQIRGRTARKDNKGSYELIVCDEHLKGQGLLRGEVSYAALDAVRTEIALKEHEDVAENIRRESNDHQTTLAYLQSFFR